MVLGLLAVEEIGLIHAVFGGQGGGGGGGQGNALIGRAEHGVEPIAAGFMNQGGVETAQGGDLTAGLIIAGVDEIRG